MVATKVTALFNCGTVDASGNAARSAGFSESWYSVLAADSQVLNDNWNRLLQFRAALLPINSRIVGQRIQTVEPALGASRSFDTVYNGTAGVQNDLPSVALQWTVRSPNTANQKQVILRGIPDARVVTGEYSGVASYNAAIVNYFAELKANWRFRAIDRSVLPVKIVTINAAGLMTTEKPHGLVANDTVQVMSTVAGDGRKESFLAFVSSAPTANTAVINVEHRLAGVEMSRGRARKYGIFYSQLDYYVSELTNPTAITRKVGRPFRQFHGRRTARRS